MYSMKGYDFLFPDVVVSRLGYDFVISERGYTEVCFFPWNLLFSSPLWWKQTSLKAVGYDILSWRDREWNRTA
jgi:hypothetical protein